MNAQTLDRIESEFSQLTLSEQVIMMERLAHHLRQSYERVSLDVETSTDVTVLDDSPESQPQSFLDVALAIEIDGPADWSENVDKYLYNWDDEDEQ